jgi:hypothetical protein
MFQYRAVLVRLRQGDSDRDIARARLMGRPKVAALRALATQHGWLAPDTPLPEDGEIAAVIGQARRARSTVSTVEPFRDLVARWAEQGVGGVAIHAALCREHHYTGRLLGGAAHAGRAGGDAPARGHVAAAVCSRRSGASRFRRRAAAARSRSRTPRAPGPS